MAMKYETIKILWVCLLKITLGNKTHNKQSINTCVGELTKSGGVGFLKVNAHIFTEGLREKTEPK